jgi:chloramphenicol 3-O-phosphotransferase
VTATNDATTANNERAGDVLPGRVVVLNGPPRSGKSSIADVIQETFDGPWLNLGVDVFSQFVTPPRLRPGMGLHPGGGERPDIGELIPWRSAPPPSAPRPRPG